jgi:hypothetical protein
MDFSRLQLRRWRPTLTIGLVAALSIAGTALATIAAPSAQQEIRLEEASPLVATTLSSRDGEALALSAATLTFTAGQASVPLTSDGVLMMVVQSGTIRILSSRGLLDAAPPENGAADVIAGIPMFGDVERRLTPDGEVDGTTIDGAEGVKSFTLPAGASVAAAPGSELQFEAETDASVLVFSVVPQGR